ncbi:MAG TPA: hypothetical protein VHV29_17780 [Terriglobales bacterium]|jgi:hypothetical protein|nr:hypothetical protein [Terriglobales bacterium]
MFRPTVHLLWIVLLCGAASGQTAHRTKAKKASKPSPAQPLPASTPSTIPPAEKVTPEHGPASPPQVSFQGGQLTIVARNSTMSDVLNAVRQKTGANVDMPAGSGDRVVGQFGPGSPRDVMAQLLNGSHYDYVLLGSPADPRALKKVVLIAKSNGPEPGPVPQANQPQGENENLQAVPDVENEPQEENSENPNVQESPQPEEPQADQGDQGDQNPPTVKTPEQLLRELQQQQQNQSGPPGAPGQPPR